MRQWHRLPHLRDFVPPIVQSLLGMNDLQIQRQIPRQRYWQSELYIIPKVCIFVKRNNVFSETVTMIQAWNYNHSIFVTHSPCRSFVNCITSYLILLIPFDSCDGRLFPSRTMTMMTVSTLPHNTPFWSRQSVTHVNTITDNRMGGRALPAMTPLSSHSQTGAASR